MISNLLKFFLLKNTLFLKIILVFTLPAIGMLYFSSVLVYEKVETLSEVSNIQKNIKYVTATQKLIHSLQKERGLSSIYVNSKEYLPKLQEQRKITDKNLINYKQEINNLSLTINIKEKITKYRKEVDSNTLNSFGIIKRYSDLNESLLDSMYSIDPVLYATQFNNRFSYIINLLLLKEYVAIERGLVSAVLSSKTLDNEIRTKLIEIYKSQDINKKRYLLKASKDEIEKFNIEITVQMTQDIEEVRRNIENYSLKYNISTQEWWDLSTSKIDALEKVYDYILVQVSKIARQTENDAYLAQFLSLTFLFVSFITLISLLFVLRNIISNEQKSFYKIKKQQDVYKLLNKTNKFLLKTNTEKVLFNKICKLVSENSSMSFGFIYRIKKDGSVKLIAQQGELKEFLDKKLINENSGNENLVSKVLKDGTNAIVKSYKEENISLVSEVAKDYNIKSAAAFPIKKFNKIVCVLVLYSNKTDFFDEEIEILFDKMINDMTHALEKMEYEKKRLHQENELRLASYAFESSEPMIITDEDAFIINANNAFCNVMGYTKIDVIGRKPSMFKSKHQSKEFYTKMWDDLINKGSWSGEVYNTKKSKEKIPLRSSITAIKDNNGKTTHYLGQYINISDQIDRQKVLEYQATHDNLTGLPNRLLLLDRIEHAITKVTRHNIVGGLIFIDLDNFKEVNDTLGHEVGDNLLIMVAKKIKKTIREEDTIARIGGDEFIVLADCIGNSKDEARVNMQVMTEKIKESLNSIKTIDGHKNISTPSLGVTLFSDASISPKDIIKQADTAMYEAKKQGKNTIEFFN